MKNAIVFDYQDMPYDLKMIYSQKIINRGYPNDCYVEWWWEEYDLSYGDKLSELEENILLVQKWMIEKENFIVPNNWTDITILIKYWW